jgi:S1-C subfamily serine protease
MITMASERGNMGFATPINVIKRVLPRRPAAKSRLGLARRTNGRRIIEQAKNLGLPLPKGVVVSAVLPGQSAAAAVSEAGRYSLGKHNHVDSPVTCCAWSAALKREKRCA